MRGLRVLYPGAVYHVTARGNEKQLIFLDETDRLQFLSQLQLAIERYGWMCHGYCLMGNHYHLLVETPRANLPVGMRHVNGCYSQWFNRRRQRVGHLLQGRYKASLIEKHPYLTELIRYMALNPMRAEPPLSTAPEFYAWSSYRILLGLAPRPSWFTSDWVLSQFGDEYETARSRLRAFVDEGLVAEPPNAISGIYFGSESFIAEKVANAEPIPEIPRRQWQPLRPALGEIFASADEPVAVAYREFGYPLREIAAYLGCHYQTVSRRLQRSEMRDRET